MHSIFSRRQFLRAGLVLPPALLAACSVPALTQSSPTPTAAPAVLPAATSEAAVLPTATSAPVAAAPVQLVPTPTCGDDDDDDPTPAQTEGPYYTPSTPERASFLHAGVTGLPLLLAGQVLATDCLPIAGALIDFWHCDDAGVYDNVGYNFRGHQFTNEQGQYQLETIVPGVYPGRTRHIHVKVQAPNQPILTTQLYFPGEPGNASDGIYNPVLELQTYASTDAGANGVFDFVLQLA